MSRKTIYIILIVIAALLVIGGIVWYLFFRQTVQVPAGGAEFTVPGGSPETAGKLKAISSGPVISASYNNSQNSLLFYDYSGQLWQLKEGAGAPEVVDQSAVENTADIIWSPNLTNIVKSGASETAARYIFTDFTKKSTSNLRSGIKSVVFSPDAKSIVYNVAENQTNSLLTSAPDGKSQRILISNFRLRDIILSWPKANQIGITSKPSGLLAGAAWVLDTRTLSFSKIMDSFFGLETLWSPDGNTVAYSFVDQNASNPEIKVNKNGNIKEIDAVSTLIGKCAWANDSVNLYCAVPKSWPEGMVLPDDFYKKTRLTNDDIWKINTVTGEKGLIASDLRAVAGIIAGRDNIYVIQEDSQILYQVNLR